MDEELISFLNILSRERGLSENTIAAYKNDITQFAAFVKKQVAKNKFEPKWDKVNRSLILSYVLDLKDAAEKNYAPATVARKTAAIKSFCGFLVTKGILEKDPTKGLGRDKVKKTLPKTISPVEAKKLLKQPEKRETLEAKRDKAMLELLYATGMRATELISLNVDDLNLEEGFVRCFKRGGKFRDIPIHKEAIQAAEAYLNEARNHLRSDPEENALFLNRRGQRLTRQGFWLILKSYAKEAKIKTEITPQTLRHSIATHLLRSGKMNLKELQEFLGHANISTTQVYAHLVR
jgi:integrase/recombinase XerD